MKFRDAGEKLALLNLSDSLGTVAEFLRLNLMFEIHHDELDAVNSFFPERVVLRYDILEFVEYCLDPFNADWNDDFAARGVGSVTE